MLAIVRKNDNQAKIIYALYEKLYIKIIEAQEQNTVDLETEKLKLVEFENTLSRLIND